MKLSLHTRPLVLCLLLTPLWSMAEPDAAPKAEKAEKPQKEEKQDDKEKEPEKAPEKAKKQAPATTEQKPNPVDQLQLNTLTPVVADARLSTVRLVSRNWGKPVCMACVVHENGWFISKASEVDKFREIDAQFASSDQFPAGLRLPVKVVTRHKDYDLALLKCEASGFKAVRWHSGSAPIPGVVLVASSPDPTPLAFGVASVDVRNMDMGNRGFLGLRINTDREVLSIVEESPAAKAGLVLKDILQKINDQEIKSPEQFQDVMSKLKPEDQVKIEIRREKETKTLEATLRRRSEFPTAMQSMEDPRNAMSGNLSVQRNGFPAALQHDLPLKPEECGSPLLDLDGNVIGLNIARSGRIDSMAVPAGVLLELLKDVPKGQFFIPEAEELKKKISTMEAEQRKANEEKDKIKKLEETLQKGISDAQKRLDSIFGPPAKK